MLDVIVLGGAGDEGEVWVGAAGVIDGEVDERLVGVGNKEDSGDFDAGGVEDFRAGDVAPDAGESGGGEVFEQGMIEFNDEHGNTGGAEGAGGGTARTAIAGEDDVVGQRLRRRRNGE